MSSSMISSTAAVNGSAMTLQEMPSSKVRQVLEDASADLNNADFLFGFISNPIRQHILKPLLGIATEVVPAVTSIVPFGDEVAACGLSIPFNTLRFGYSILHFNDDGKLTTILEDARVEMREMTDLAKLELNKVERTIEHGKRVEAIGLRGYLIAATVEFLGDPESRLAEWKEASDNLTAFLQHSGISDDLKKARLSPRFQNNMRIIGNVQSVYCSAIDRRQKTQLGPESRPFRTPLKEVAKLMRYCTASYGKDMMEAQELYAGTKDVSLFDSQALPIDSKGKLNEEALQLGSESLKQKVCQHVGIPMDYIRYFYLGYGGDMKLIRHYISVDHELGAVVLVIRGTQSWSGWNVDAQGMGKPFCHGIAHAGMADMGTSLMEHSKGEILKCLDEVPNYKLLITGQSLGSGVACLVNLLCHVDKDIGKLSDIECHAFGGPPVYKKGGSNPYVDEAIKNCVVYVHREDVVPHISVNSVHQLLAKLIAVDEVTKRMSWIDQDLVGAGRKMPSDALVAAVKTGDSGNHRGVEGAPRLMNPAARIVWFRGSDYNTGKTAKYTMMLCDSKKVADLGILVSKDMFSDHPPERYETCLNEIEIIGWEVLNRY